MVATCNHVDVLVLEDVKCVVTFRHTGIVQAVSFNTVSCVDQEEI